MSEVRRHQRLESSLTFAWDGYPNFVHAYTALFRRVFLHIQYLLELCVCLSFGIWGIHPVCPFRRVLAIDFDSHSIRTTVLLLSSHNYLLQLPTLSREPSNLQSCCVPFLESGVEWVERHSS